MLCGNVIAITPRTDFSQVNAEIECKNKSLSFANLRGNWLEGRGWEKGYCLFKQKSSYSQNSRGAKERPVRGSCAHMGGLRSRFLVLNCRKVTRPLVLSTYSFSESESTTPTHMIGRVVAMYAYGQIGDDCL